MNIGSIENIGTLFPSWELESGIVDGNPFLFLKCGSIKIPLDMQIFCADGKLVADPFADMTDVEINCVPEGSDHDVLHRLHWSQVEYLESQLNVPPRVGHHLIQCATQGGYDARISGSREASWILNNIANLIDERDRMSLEAVVVA